ncbi:MAG: RNA 2',3'-cyclic phosphodiesterase, partial [Armatimonadota bacterium]
QRLQSARAAVKWVEPDNLHLTLKFLGNIPEAQVEPIAGALEGVACDTAPFVAHVAGVGAFPNLKRPRVVWAGIASGSDELKRLAANVQEALVPLGFDPERREFSAHLTLGRVKSFVNVAGLAEAIRQEAEADLGPMPVEAVHLMQSELRPSGPMYSALAQLSLRG